MRPISFTPSSVRTIGVKARYTAPLPDWTALTPHNDTLAETVNAYDSDNQGNVITRVANVGANLLASQYLDVSNFDGPFNPWVVSAITLKDGSRPGIREQVVYYQLANGEVWEGYVAADGFTENSKVYEDTEHALSIAPISSTAFYAEYLDNTHTKRIFRYDTETDTKVDWYGAIYGECLEISTFDAESWYMRTGTGTGDGNLVEYIYFTEESGSRAMWMIYSEGLWSDPKYVFPLDVLDDTSYYKLGLVSNINDLNLILTTKTKRKNGDAYRTYHLGPERWTTGREMILGVDNADSNLPGKVYLCGNLLFYIYYGGWYWSPYAEFFGGSNGYPYVDNWVDIDEDIISAKVSSSGPTAQLDQMELKNALTGLTSNQTLELTAVINGTDYKLGTYDIDAVAKGEHGQGKTQEITGRSNASKRLSQWQADTSYDFWSQTKQNSGAEDRGEFGIVTGQYVWEPNKTCTDPFDPESCTYPDAKMYPSDLNVPGYLYVTSKACRDGSMRAEFKRLAGTYHARFGVGLHFYQLNVVEISEYLVKDMDDVTQEESNSIKANGIVAVYGDDEDSGSPGVGLYKVRNGVMTQIDSAGLVIADDENCLLMITSHSGYFNVYYREDTDVAWTHVLSHSYTEDDGLWISGALADKIGRGFLYLENYTPHQDCYPFQSDDDYIPLKGSHSEFPSSGDVIVDDERIGYASKSANVTKYGPYPYGGMRTIEENTDESGGVVGFSVDRSLVAVRQQITAGQFYVRRIKVYAAQYGSPTDGMQVCIYTTPVNKKTPAGRQVSAVTVPISDFGADGVYGWKTADFPANTVMSNGDWIMLYRENNPTHPEMSFGYFGVIANDGYAIECETFDEDSDAWSGGWGGAFGFQIFGTPIGSGNYYGVQITGGPNVSDLVGSALVVTDGTGKNYSWKIVGYTYGTPASTVYVEEDAEEILGADSYLSIAPTLIGLTRGENYAGLARQVETATVVATIGTSGNATVTVRATGMENTPKDVSVAVLNGDNANDVAGKIRTALGNDADVGDFFTVSGADAAVILTAKKVASNDVSMNIGIKNGSCTGITAAPRSANTTTGVNTIASSHGETVVSIFSEHQVELIRAQYFSTDLDLSVGDMAKEICTKAGCVATSRLNDVSGTDIETGAEDMSISKGVRNFILKIRGDFQNNRIGVFAYINPPGSASQNEVFYLYNNVLYCDSTTDDINFTPVEEIAIKELEGIDISDAEVTFSFNLGTISVWIGDLYLHTFVAYHTEWDSETKTAGVYTKDATTIDVVWEEADIRVDNFILDMGQSGGKLLDTMIGEKRVWFTDKSDGTIEIFTSNTDVGAVTLGVQKGNLETNDVLATRVRAEGGDVSERTDQAALAKFGNIFRLINAREAYDVNDAKRFADYALEDMVGRTYYTTWQGAADPRLEPYDKVEIPTGEIAIIDNVSLIMGITMEEAIFDMNVRVRWLDSEM